MSNEFPNITFDVVQHEHDTAMWRVQVFVKKTVVARFDLQHSDAQSVCGAARLAILRSMLVGLGFRSPCE
jgi:hypothetical protein